MYSFIITSAEITFIVALVLLAGAAALIACGQSKYKRTSARIGSALLLAAMVAGSVAISWNVDRKPTTPKKEEQVTKTVTDHNTLSV